MSKENFHITISETMPMRIPWYKSLINEYDIQAEKDEAYQAIAQEIIKLDPTPYKDGLYVRAVNENDETEAFLLVPTEENGVKSFFVRSAYGRGFDSSYQDCDEKKRYLVCLDEDTNDYKSYTMFQENGDDSFNVSYGRIGGTDLLDRSKYNFDKEGSRGYPAKMFWIKYYEKILKGYTDKTEEMDIGYDKEAKPKVKPKELTEYKPIEEEETRDLIELLIKSQRDYVQKNYYYNENEIKASLNSKAIEHTDKMLKEMNDLVIQYVKSDNDVEKGFAEDEFKRLYKEVLVTLPRKVKNVKEYIERVNFTDTSSPDYVVSVLDNEKDMLQALKDVTGLTDVPKKEAENSGKDNTVLEQFGLSAKVPDFEDKFNVLDKMGDEAYKVSRIIEVRNERTAKAYEACKKEMGIHDGGCHLLWHGSRTENWWSIYKNGMSLNPNAVITGKMFGQGLYFAPLAKKSMGYVDMRGSRWANGSDNKGHLALFEVAMGKPYSPDYALGSSFTGKDLRHGCHSVWAKASKGFLYNDECIVYREDQCNMKYLVEVEYDRTKEYNFDLKAARNISIESPYVEDSKFLRAGLTGFYDAIGKSVGISDKPVTGQYDLETGEFKLFIEDARYTAGERQITALNSTEETYLRDVFMSKFAVNKREFDILAERYLNEGIKTKESKLLDLLNGTEEFMNLGIQEHNGIKYDSFQCIYNSDALISSLCELYGIDKSDMDKKNPAVAELYLDIAENFEDIYIEGNVYDDADKIISLGNTPDLTLDTDKSLLTDKIKQLKIADTTMENLVVQTFEEYGQEENSRHKHMKRTAVGRD